MFGVAVVVGTLDGAEPAGLTMTAAIKMTASAAAASLVADEFAITTAELDESCWTWRLFLFCSKFWLDCLNDADKESVLLLL